MSVFKYDTLDILDRAEKSASDWWSKTLDNAKKRTDMDQQLFKSAFDNDKLMRTHEGDVFRTGAENVYRGTKANYDTMLEPDRYNRDKSQMGRDTLRSDDESWQLRNAMTPENMDARRVVQNNRFQSPAAALEAGAAAAGIPDVQRAAQVGAMTATYRPGALSTQAEYGRTATQAGALNLANEVAAGNLSGANEALRAGGFGMEVRPGPTPDTVVIVDQNGRQSMPLDRSMAAATIRDRTGTRQGQAGAYLGKVEDQDRRFAQQSQLNTDRIAQRDRQLQFRANTELGKRLADRVKNARTDDERMAAQMDYDEYLNEQGPDTFTPSYGGGAPAAPAASVPFTPASLNPASQAPAGPGVVNPTARAAWSAGMAPAAAPAPAAPAPAAPAAKATAPAQAPAAASQAAAPAVGQGGYAYKPGEVTDAVMTDVEAAYESANSKAQQIRRDLERADSLNGRRSVPPEMREKIQKAFEVAQAELEKARRMRQDAKKAWTKDKADAAYNPYKALEQPRNERLMNDLSSRYGKP